MKTEQEMTSDKIKKALEICADINLNCNDCPYDAVGNCNDTLSADALKLITEQEKEIERLQDKCEELRNEKWDAQDDLDCYCDEMPNKIKQAQIDILNKVMTYINNKIEAEYGDMSDSVKYLTINIDDFDDFIDELIKEVQND